MASAEVVPVQTPGGRGQKPQRSERFLGPKEETGPQRLATRLRGLKLENGEREAAHRKTAPSVSQPRLLHLLHQW